VFQNALTDCLIVKNISRSVSGTMLSVYQFVGSIGTLTFSKAGGYLHDTQGAVYPFVLIGSLDLLLLIIISYLVIRGKFD